MSEHSFEQAYAEVQRIHQQSLPNLDPMAKQVMEMTMDRFKPLFQEFYKLGVEHGKAQKSP